MNFAIAVSNMINLPGAISSTSSHVQWLSFTALAQDFNIYLQWTVAGRRNVDDFIIQHSIDGADWVMLHGHISRGSSHSSTQFNFIHARAAKGLNYYRIICKEQDHSFDYSEIRRVNVEEDSRAFSLETIAVINSLIKIHIRKPVYLTIYTAAGKLLHSSRYAPGVQTIEICKTTEGICWVDAGDQKEKVIVHLT